jgi:apolipoprotein N-acyltransferase
MMKSKNVFLCCGFLLALFASPFSILLSAGAFFIGYPLLIHSFFSINTSLKRGFAFYGFGVLYMMVQMRWLCLAQYHGTIIIGIYALLSCLFAYPFFCLGYLLPQKAESLNFRRILFIAVVFSVLEYMRLFIICGFPFHTVGMILTSHIYPLQLASVVGMYGLSALVIGFALLGARLISEKRYSEMGWMLMPLFIGFALFQIEKVTSHDETNLDVAIIQPGLRVEQKWDLEGFDNTFISDVDQLKRIWEDLQELPPRDLVFLPEVILPGDAAEDRFSQLELKGVFGEDVYPFFKDKGDLSLIEIFSMLSLYLNTDIMVGLAESTYNSAFYFSLGELVGRYDKKRLVAFGEYIPFSFLSNLAAKYGLVGSFTPGITKDLIHGKCRILSSICYDEGFPEDFLSQTTLQPQLHVNLTNDAWFVDSSLIEHHFLLGVVRSVETGLYSVRACNTGVSGIISPTGEVLQKIAEKTSDGVMNRSTIVESIKLYSKKTPFLYLGNLRLLAISALLFLMLSFFARKASSLKT